MMTATDVDPGTKPAKSGRPALRDISEVKLADYKKDADKLVLKVLVDENPRNEKSGAHEHFSRYQDGMKFSDMMESDDFEWRHMRYDIARDYIAFEEE